MLTALLLVVLLSSCATTPLNPVRKHLLQQRITALESVDTWIIEGRLAIKNKDDGLTVTIHWKQRGDRFDITLTDPLGRRVAELQGDQYRVTMKSSKGQLIEGVDPEKLQMHYLGWALPLGHLQGWIRALPAQDVVIDDDVYDGTGRLLSMSQDGWQVQFKRYETSALLAMPELIILEKQQFRAKLLVDIRQSGS